MRRELKNLLTQLTKHSEENWTIFGSNLELRLYYIFLRRYDAIRDDFDLPQFGYKLDKYFRENVHCYPYEDLIKPFFELLREKNPSTFDRITLEAYFKSPEPLDVLDPSEIRTINRAIKDSGISEFGIENYSVEEFDEFFTQLIEKTKTKRESTVWQRVLNEKFAKFISKLIPSQANGLFIGDEKAEIAYQSDSDNGVKTITSNHDSILWYYLRVILTGKWNVRLHTNELGSFIQSSYDFIFVHPPVGNITVSDRNELSNDLGIDFDFRTWEGFYTKLALRVKKKGGKGFLLLPSGFLYRNNKDYSTFRKNLIEDKAVRSIIRLPKGLLEPETSISFSLVEIDYSQEYNSVRFINGMEITSSLYPQKSAETQDFFYETLGYWRGRMGFYPYVQNIDVNDIEAQQYSFAFSNYFNVSRNVNEHIRSREEELVSLTDALKRIKLKPGNKINNVPLLGITELAENLVEYEINASSLPKVDEIKRAKKLERSAILIGKIVGSVKPSYFKYDGQEIYIKPNVLAFEVPEALVPQNIVLDPQYIVQELRSDFVTSQFQKIETASVIPSFSNQVLKNIYLRIPPLKKQKEYYKDAVAKLAKQSLEDLKISDQEFRLVENKILSSFKHDFMQILLKVSSNIEVLENYLHHLDEKGIIRLEDSVFLEDTGKIKDTDKVKSLLNRLKANNSQSIKFLEDEIRRLSKNQGEVKKEIIDVKAFLKKWKKDVGQNGFRIEIKEDEVVKMFNDSGKKTPYQIEIVEQDLRSILRNLLSNAVKHGFDKGKTDNIFRINLWMPTIGDRVYVELEVLNNGKPLPEDFSYDDLFEYKHKGPDSVGDGVGGYSIKKAVKNNQGKISYNSEKHDSEFPFRLSIKFLAVLD